MNRRQFLTNSIISALGLSACGGSSSNKTTSNATGGMGGGASGEYKTVLFIPEELKGETKAGITSYDLSLQAGSHQFLDGKSTPTWGINANYLGPTLRLKKGANVNINYRNKLGEETTMHGHGMHVPANMDGGVHQIIQPNETWTAAYTVKQQACTNWYHPHLMGKTAQHVMKGLAGMIIIDDNQSEALDLPKRYGIDDIPLIIQDRRFNTDGSFDYNPSNRDKMHGWKGDTFLVNGTITPYLDLEAKQIRFRILNGSNSRIYTFALASGKSFQQIATDNSFLETPVTLNQLRLSPAERAEIIIDFSTSLGQTELLIDKSSDKALFKINISKPATVTTKLPQTLVKRLLLNADDAVNTRSFSLSGRAGNLTINGLTMNKEVINESIPLNAIEVWEVNNMMDMDHNFHIHATHFQIIERNGSSATVAENEKGFKDTVFIPANESVKLIIKMIDYTDSKSPYMYHCHILEHEDLGMMGQFVVV
jgi:FtsP/CotA-like multicopper oxidase with cupredoxin domain